MKEHNSKLTFTVNVRLEQVREQESPDVMVYAFDAVGQFLDATPLPKGASGEVKLELPSELAGTTIRVVLGPRQAEERTQVPGWMDKLMGRSEGLREGPSLARLVRRDGYEKRVRLAAEGGTLHLSVMPPDWEKWLLCSCVVRGRLIKRVPLPDGTTKELGVCHACVKIYEVDKIPKVILRLPERDLFRLRHELLNVFDKPLPKPPEVIPIPPPPPPPDRMAEMGGHETIIGLGGAPARGSPIESPVIPLPPPESRSLLHAKVLPLGDRLRSELEPIFRATSVSRLRTLLIGKAELLADYLCAFEWLWHWFHTDLIKCVCTDEQGRFATTIWYPCAGDKPDLYFKAVQCIGGSLHTLYDPGVACHTHWDYVCGTEIVLETDDPAAITCTPPDPIESPPGVSLWVMPHSVGKIRLDQIKPSGLTDYTYGVGTWVDAPFGGRLGFCLGHSSSIPYDVPGQPAYYRWLYNKLDSADDETEWREFAAPVGRTVVRHYVDYDLAHPDQPPTFPVYTLGPQEKSGMHLYEFKPHDPPVAVGHKREWPVDDWFADIYSGILDSTILPGGVANAAGKYKIKLEVFDKDGEAITPGPDTFDFIVPTGKAGDGVTILTRKATASEIEGNGFVFYLHVDNNKCEAGIYEASVNGVAAGPCGFIAYGPGDDVRLSFKAKHPNGYARFKFTVVRGSAGYVPAACAPASSGVGWASAPLVTDTHVDGFDRDLASVFTKDVDEAVIRGSCTKAAFGENLYVAAAATNGWVRLSGLDASALPKAFALEPKTK